MAKRILNFRVLIRQDEDGMFVASVPALPGCHTQGDTYEEAIENIEEAIELCLQVAGKDLKYRNKIDLKGAATGRFVGITDVPVKVSAFPA